ncbi:MAG: SPOR domain-containing protein [Sediminibacterium sp.]|nr:SPOR domain-containing protein [uncultured Sediminibacterium sp.]
MSVLIRCISICLLLFSAMELWAADTIVVKKDSRLDLLTAKQAQLNKRTAMLTSDGQYKGYRLQVISTNSRDQAFRIKTELLSRFPDHKTYTSYQSPLFKVRIGNFVRREDAEQFRKLLNRFYPKGVYVVEDVIEYNLAEDELAQ